MNLPPPENEFAPPKNEFALPQIVDLRILVPIRHPPQQKTLTFLGNIS